MVRLDKVRWAARLCVVFAAILSTLLLLPSKGFAASLEKYSQSIVAGEMMPGAESYGAKLDGREILPVIKNKKTVGYAFLNTDFSGAIGYSGKPIVVLIGMDLKGQITGAKLVHHTEPIVLAGIPEEKIASFIDSYKSLNIPEVANATKSTPPPADIVSGATVTILVIDDSIKRAAIRVARILGLGGLSVVTSTNKAKRTLKRDAGKVEDWTTLIGNGSVRRLRLTVKDINDAFVNTGNKKAIDRPEEGKPDELFIDFYVASLAIDSVAKSLLGNAEYKNLKKRMKSDQEAFLIMGNGRYSFKGSGYVRGGIFDRISIIQGENTVRFRDRGHKRIADVLAKGAPRFREVGIFKTPKNANFNPAENWVIQLLAQRVIGALKKVFVTFDLGYQIPAAFVEIEKTPIPAGPTANEQVERNLAERDALWKRIWQQRMVSVIILVIAISILTIAFFFQDYLTLSAKITKRFRTVFLLFTLLWIGFYEQAQLSVVNVLVFANALLGDFRWEFFLLEPLIFILWCSVAVAVLFWGRGAYCGWLCPFGALQEITNQIARYFKVPQLTLPWGLHERLWPIKYLIFLALLGASVYSLAMAEQLAEVEPFKTSIILKFSRSWPYLLFVAVLLFIGLFIERFYCRYLCPLGAALAIPARMAMFQWLHRYKNCGDPCHRCAQDCPVQAIDPLGNINPNECVNCLNCLQMYNNKELCPVVILRESKAKKAAGNSTDTNKVDEAKSQVKRGRRLGREREIEA